MKSETPRTNEAPRLHRDDDRQLPCRNRLTGRHLPTQALVDGIHVGIAAVNGIEYLLTWNLRHLANAVIRSKINEAVRNAGLVPPIICTPEELMEAKS